MTSAKRNTKRHVSHDGSIREYDYEINEWTVIGQQNNNNDEEKKQPLAIDGRIFDIYKYWPYLNGKQIMNLNALNTFESTFNINGNVLYIGNMINNELKSRESLKQQHGDTGNNLWDTSILFAKCLEYNTFTKNDNKFNKMLNLSAKNVLELGTGTGFLGLSAIHCNANDVWLTDLEYCTKNIEINVDKNRYLWDLYHKDTMDKTNINPFDKVSVFEIDWANADKSLLKYNKIKKNSVDMIIGSDIIWIKELVPMLVDTMQYLHENILKKDIGIIVIGEQIRSNVVSGLFWSLMKSKGFYRNEIPHKLYHPDFTSDSIKIYIVSHKDV